MIKSNKIILVKVMGKQRGSTTERERQSTFGAEKYVERTCQPGKQKQVHEYKIASEKVNAQEE